MRNKAMERKINKEECIDVANIGKEIHPGLWELFKFEEDVDYCIIN